MDDRAQVWMSVRVRNEASTLTPITHFMDADLHRQFIQDLLQPENVDSHAILEELGVGSIPTREQIHREIEEKLLLPQDRLPSHWLPSHQMCVRAFQYNSPMDLRSPKLLGK